MPIYIEFAILESSCNKQWCLKLNLSVYYVSCLLLTSIAQFYDIEMIFIHDTHARLIRHINLHILLHYQQILTYYSLFIEEVFIIYACNHQMVKLASFV